MRGSGGDRFDGLAWAAAAVLLVSILHELDHLANQPTRHFSVAVLLAAAASGATLWFALRRNPLAPLAGLATGFATAVGFAAIHLAPHWSALSSPYSEAGINWLSWAIVYLAIAAGLALALISAAMLLRPAPAAP